MLFSSLTFLFLFLPLCLLFYFISKPKLKNIILLLFSLLFYSWGEPKYVILMVLTIFISWIFGFLINYFDNKKKIKLKRLTLIISIILIVSSLIYFKYTNFIFENINNLFKTNLGIENIILPIGISFYTFQILTYIIDLYRKKIKLQRNLFDLALYISFFPQLIAGPIVKYEDIENQLKNRTETFDKVISGIERFIIGLGKKVIIANNVALIADTIFNHAYLNELTCPVLLLGIISYTFQIYFDFSGYSDMAIGLGKIFGFEFVENFNYPYMAKSITDFWKRWHISLTTFFREYVYIPLGGNRVSKSRWLLNMFIVWLLTGLWHGAAWVFILWGMYYFILLLLEKTILKNILSKIPGFIRYIVTFILINIGWTIFRANRLKDLLTICLGIFSFKGIDLITFINQNINIIPSIPYVIIAFICSFDIFKRLEIKYKDKTIYNIAKKFCLIGILVTCIMFLTSSMYNPFIYFRF